MIRGKFGFLLLVSALLALVVAVGSCGKSSSTGKVTVKVQKV